jgi:S1-C subfamily serine protease
LEEQTLVTFIRTFFVLVLGILVGAATVVGYLDRNPPVAATAPAAPLVQSPAPTPPPVQTTVQERPALLPVLAPSALVGEDIVIDVYQRVSPSVVSVTTARARTQSQGPVPDFPQSGMGSGFIIDRQGHILTNNHVVADATSLEVTLSDDTTVPATVLGRDPGNDLALLKIEVPADRLNPVVLGDSDRLQVGQLAIAIGNPFGLSRSVTTGVVSSIGRNRARDNQRPIRNMIQTDAPINPGNSGGPLLNSRGEVIGINTAIESPVRGSVGIGFAVPINTAKTFLPQMMGGATIRHPWVGISGVAITPSVKQDLSLNVDSGVYVVQVLPSSPAEQAGLRGAERAGTVPGSRDLPPGGDVITAIDGRSVAKVEDVSGYLDGKNVGDVVVLTIIRAGERRTLNVTLAEWPGRPGG